MMLVVAWYCTMGAWASDFEANGIYYGITSTADKTVEVVSGDAKYSSDVTIPAMVTYDGITYRVTAIKNRAFYDCRDLTSIVLPDSLTSIGREAFAGCSNLTAITIPEGVTEIGQVTFSDCSSLTTIILPQSLMSIGSSAFYNCSSLTSIVIPEKVTEIKAATFIYSI